MTHLDQDGRPDIIQLDFRGGILPLRNRTERWGRSAPPAFEPWPCTPLNWRSAIACDLDLDGRTDLLGLFSPGESRELRWARNQTIELAETPLSIERSNDAAKRATSLCLVDLVGDPLPDLLMFQDGDSPRIARNLGNGHNWLALALAGRWQDWGKLRSNPHGIGARIRLQGPGLETTVEAATPTSGLAHSVAPWIMGLGVAKRAAIVRIRWPDGASQTEVNIPANRAMVLEEQTHRVSTCPILFAWDGCRYRCVSDLLAGGGLGYYLAPGVYAEPDRDEAVAIPDELLCPDARGLAHRHRRADGRDGLS